MKRTKYSGLKQILDDKRSTYREDDDGSRDSGLLADRQEEIARLVDLAAAGDAGAFTKLYRLYQKKLYQYIAYQVKDKMVAEDVTSDVFIKVLERIHTCRGKGRSFTGWIYRIARNRVIDYFRHNQRRLAVETDNENILRNVSESPLSDLENKELLTVISKLPEVPRQVIMLKFIIGLNNEEISQVVKKSTGAVRIIQMRALATLRQTLDTEGQ